MEGEWYVLATTPGAESDTAKRLEDAGYETQGLIKVKRVHRRTKRLIPCREPIFPGYVFCLVNVHWPNLRRIPGAVGFLRASRESEPMPIPHETVAGLHSRDVAGVKTDGPVDIGSILPVSVFGVKIGMKVVSLHGDRVFLESKWGGKKVRLERLTSEFRAA